MAHQLEPTDEPELELLRGALSARGVPISRWPIRGGSGDDGTSFQRHPDGSWLMLDYERGRPRQLVRIYHCREDAFAAAFDDAARPDRHGQKERFERLRSKAPRATADSPSDDDLWVTAAREILTHSGLDPDQLYAVAIHPESLPPAEPDGPEFAVLCTTDDHSGVANHARFIELVEQRDIPRRPRPITTVHRRHVDPEGHHTWTPAVTIDGNGWDAVLLDLALPAPIA